MLIFNSYVSTQHWEFKAAVPPTLLLGLVFMQQSYQVEIPNLAYFTYLDKLYVVAYSLTIWSFAQSVLIHKVSGHERQQLTESLSKGTFIATLILAPILLWFL